MSGTERKPRGSGTCHQCRRRKVRCDGGRPGSQCRDCDRLGLACSFQRRDGDTASEQQGCERLRGKAACARCKLQKIKCSGDLPQCSGCQRKGMRCVYHGPNRRSRFVSDASLPLGNSALAAENTQLLLAAESPETSCTSPAAALRPDPRSGPPKDDSMQSMHSRLSRASIKPLPSELLSLVHAYFRHLYPLCGFSFLHEASVVSTCEEGGLDETLALALCAITAVRVRRERYPETVTSAWAERVQNNIWEAFEQPTIARLQALLLVTRYLQDTGRFQRAFMLHSIAARSANALRLNYERPDLPFLAQELRRRLMWSLVHLDASFSIGLPEFELCPYENIYLQLPYPESSFETNTQDGPDYLDPDGPKLGLYAFFIRTLTLRRDIIRLRRQLFLCPPPTSQILDIMRSFEESLNNLESYVMDSLALSPAAVEHGAPERWPSRSYTALLGWHQCNCDFYRMYLPGYREAAPGTAIAGVDRHYVRKAARVCQEHALSIIDIVLRMNQRLSGDDITDTDAAICAFHAARLVLFISNTDIEMERVSLEKALSHATMCLAFLRRFFKFSAMAKYMIADLQKTIDAYVLGQCAPNTDVSSDSEDNQLTSPTGYSRVAISHQRLGVHSITRRAHFVDDSNQAYTSHPVSRELTASADGRGNLCSSSPNNLWQGPQKSSDQSEFGIPLATHLPVLHDARLTGLGPLLSNTLGYHSPGQYPLVDSGFTPGYHPWMSWQQTLNREHAENSNGDIS